MEALTSAFDVVRARVACACFCVFARVLLGSRHAQLTPRPRAELNVKFGELEDELRLFQENIRRLHRFQASYLDLCELWMECLARAGQQGAIERAGVAIDFSTGRSAPVGDLATTAPAFS